jgi:hypothetical protein
MFIRQLIRTTKVEDIQISPTSHGVTVTLPNPSGPPRFSLLQARIWHQHISEKIEPYRSAY